MVPAESGVWEFYVVGFCQTGDWEFLEAETVFLARIPRELPLANTRSSNRGDAHAIAEKQD
jgi:hypothetical protein